MIHPGNTELLIVQNREALLIRSSGIYETHSQAGLANWIPHVKSSQTDQKTGFFFRALFGLFLQAEGSKTDTAARF